MSPYPHFLCGWKLFSCLVLKCYECVNRGNYCEGGCCPLFHLECSKLCSVGGLHEATDVWRKALSLLLSMHGTPGSPHCFFDGSYSAIDGSTTYGTVLFSGEGDFVATSNGPLRFCTNALMAESFAGKETLSWLKDHGVATIALHTDCLVLHCYINSSTISPKSHVGVVIND